jgi:hypothetical protein
MKFVKQLLHSQKSLYFVLIAIGALISVYFWMQTVRVFVVNHSLNERRPAQINRWEVEEISSDRYVLAAHFSFEAAGQIFYGKTRFDHPAYLNPDSAIQSLKEKIAHPEVQTAWLDRDNPIRSSLEKKSLWGLLFRAALSSGVLIHFIFLRKSQLQNCLGAVKQ